MKISYQRPYLLIFQTTQTIWNSLPEFANIDLDAVKSDEPIDEETAIASPLMPRQLFQDGGHEDDDDDVAEKDEEALLDLIEKGL